MRLFLFKDTLFNVYGLFRSTELTASSPQAGAEQGFSMLRVLFIRRVPASLYSEARQHCSPALGAILNREIASKAQRCGKRGTKETTREDAYLQRVKQEAVSPSSTPAGTVNFKWLQFFAVLFKPMEDWESTASVELEVTSKLWQAGRFTDLESQIMSTNCVRTLVALWLCLSEAALNIVWGGGWTRQFPMLSLTCCHALIWLLSPRGCIWWWDRKTCGTQVPLLRSLHPR